MTVAGRALTLARLRRDRDRAVGHFEFWPDWLFYAPVALQWIALGLWYGDQSLPTAANPCIELGGLCGESKTAILDQLAPEARRWVAPYCVLRAGTGVTEAEAARAAAGLIYPLIVKPDIGCNGTGVRLVRDAAALGDYLVAFPRGARAMLQTYVADECEAGLFYVRRPGAARGRITSVTLKYAPSVVGDGRSSVAALVAADPRLGIVPHFTAERLGARGAAVPRQGERVRLLLVGNHCKGAIFADGRDQLTPALEARIDGLACALPDFHFGRFDVRFASLPALRRGEGLTVIEINGAGSEATHVWDPRTRLRDAWADELWHFREAFAIGAAMRSRGARPAGLGAMWRHWRMQRRLMRAYPAND